MFLTLKCNQNNAEKLKTNVKANNYTNENPNESEVVRKARKNKIIYKV